LIGKSWNPMLSGKVDAIRTEQDYLAWEVFGNRAVRQGDWKIRWQIKPFGTGDWELFNLKSDPSEHKDLSAERPDKLKAMVALWDQYAKANNVILPSRGPFETAEKQLPQRVRDDPGFPPLIYKRQFVPPADMLADPKP
jgi:arylsulfatase